MPELPEVETVTKALRQSVIGRRIASIVFSDYKLRIPYPTTNLIKNSINCEITAVYRRAKYILIELDNSLAIVIHLGMSGKVLISKSNIPDRKHDHARIGLMGNDEIELVYNDPRRFGLISILNMSELSTHRLFKNLGIEPLTDQFDGAYMMKTCRNHHGPIKNIIMKNEILVGVGNIYASESLFLSGINPLKPANKLSIDEYTQLSLAIKQVLVAAINSGGSTLRDYNQLNGESGYFQHMFQVYGRYNKPCYVCATPIEQIKLAGRTSFYCPKCQSMEC